MSTLAEIEMAVPQLNADELSQLGRLSGEDNLLEEMTDGARD